MSLQQFKLRLCISREAILKYEGGTGLPAHFIQQCDKFTMSLTTADPVINKALFASIESKISGGALDLIVANNSPTWLACKNILVNRFSDPSSEDLLFNKLSTCYKKTNQSKIKEHIRLNNQDATIIDMKNRFYENVAKNTFVNGTKGPYHSF